MKRGDHEIRAAELRHPDLNRPYFYEYTFCSDFVKKSFNGSFSFDLYHLGELDQCEKLRSYIVGLVERSEGIPVFKFCRSIGRLPWIRSNIDAVHLGLIRNPKDQWASYKINSYFHSTVKKILAAPQCPPTLLRLASQFDRFESRKELSSLSMSYEERHNIFHFMVIWVWTQKNLERYTDVLIDIDCLAKDSAYRESILSRLVAVGVSSLKFDDCRVESRVFSKEVSRYFEAAQLFILDGIDGCDF